MRIRAEIAMMRLALDALEDRAAPLVLALAAHRFVYHGERETFEALLRAAASRLPATAGSGEE